MNRLMLSFLVIRFLHVALMPAKRGKILPLILLLMFAAVKEWHGEASGKENLVEHFSRNENGKVKYYLKVVHCFFSPSLLLSQGTQIILPIGSCTFPKNRQLYFSPRWALKQKANILLSSVEKGMCHFCLLTLMWLMQGRKPNSVQLLDSTIGYFWKHFRCFN